MLLLHDVLPENLYREPSFAVSSCFPLIAGRFYFPVPAGALDKVMDAVAHMETGQLPFDLKDLKKIRYLSENLFRKVMAGKDLDLTDFEKLSVFPPPARSAQEENLQDVVLKTAQRPRVAVDQVVGGVQEGAFFHCTDQFFGKDAGMFFLASFDDLKTRELFDGGLRLLGDSGLGADRSEGRG
jgi:CRISPR-associated protein Csm4